MVPVWVAALIGAGPIIVPLARRLLVGIGFGLVTFLGVSTLWSNLQANILSNMGSTSASIATILALARVDDAIVLIMSAGTSLLALRGLNQAGNIVAPRWKWID